MSKYGEYYDDKFLNLLDLNRNVKYKKICIIKSFVKKLFYNTNSDKFKIDVINLMSKSKNKNKIVRYLDIIEIKTIDLSGNIINNLDLSGNIYHDINISLFYEKNLNIYEAVKNICKFFERKLNDNFFIYTDRGKKINNLYL